MTDLSRRDTLRLLALTPALAASATAPVKSQEQASSLVAYFSRTGNTRVIAHQIRRAMGADIFEIVPSMPYPEDYQETVDQARQETVEGLRPDLRDRVETIEGYDTIYLGLPIWGTTAPPIIRAFLSEYDLGGTTIVPFITHGGYGPGSSLAVIAEHAPAAQLAEALIMEADQERRTLEQVTGWLSDRST